MNLLKSVRDRLSRVVKHFHPRYHAPEFFPPNPIWRDLRHALLGVALCLSVIYLLASAEEESLLPRPQRAVTAAIMNLGEYICRNHDGIVAVTNLDDNMMRFRCRTGTVIEERVIIK